MPSELVSCPDCQRKLRVPNELIGKTVKCPTCGHTFTADPTIQAPPPPPPPSPAEDRPARTSKVSRDDRDDDEDDDEERSRRKRRRSRRDDDDDDDDDDRPRRRSRSRRDDDDDDDDDRPRRRRRPRYLAHRGGAVLALGIMGFFGSLFVPMGGLVCGIVAWVMANNDLAEMRAGRMDPEGMGQTSGGRACAIVAVVLHIVALVAVVGLFLAMCLGATAAGGGRH
jgi:predicted Zn finger-like uncharacterized protein